MGSDRPRIITTVCIVKNGDEVLLGMKKRGFGQGRWNGFGGKLGKSETVEEAAIREVKEEAGLALASITRIGQIDFHFEGEEEIQEVHFFKSEDYEGTVEESEEMRPQWFHIEKIPYSEMWPDDKHWMPLLLKDITFSGKVFFDSEGEIREYLVTENSLI